MWWETPIVLAAVAASVLFLARAARKSLAGRAGCASGCGGSCESPSASRPLAGDPLDFRTGFPPTGRTRS